MKEGCKHCETLEKKENILYEDDKFAALIPAKPATKGHIQLISKEHAETMQDLDGKDVEHAWYAASFTATALFENLQAQGTNLIVNTGSEMKKGGHFHIDVLARYNEDGLNLLWQPKKLGEDEMKKLQAKIKDKCDMIGVERKEKEVLDLDRKPEKIESGEEKAPEDWKKETGEESPKEKNSRKTEEGADEKKPKKQEKETGKTGKKKKKKEPEESYLIRQLRRIP